MVSFIKVVEENQAKVRAYIRILGIRSDSIDDIAQDVFLTAFKKFDNFDKTKEISSWLYGISRNLVNNERRKNARRARIMNDNLTEFMVDNATDVSSKAIHQEDMIELMNNCMGELSDSSRKLLKHVDEKDHNPNEMAEFMQRSAGSIRQALRRIRKTLHICIKSAMGDLAYD